jgi:hypothetical protein
VAQADKFYLPRQSRFLGFLDGSFTHIHENPNLINIPEHCPTAPPKQPSKPLLSLCYRFVENSNLLAQLPPGNEHRPDNQRDVGTVEQQSFNLSVKWQSRQSPHRAGQ